MPQAVSAAFNPTTILSSIPTIVPTLKPKPVPSIPGAGNKVVRFVQDTTKKKEDEGEVEVSAPTTTQEDDEDSPDSEGSFTTLADIGTNQKANQEDVEDNLQASDDNPDVVVEEANVIVKRAFLEAEQPIVKDDQHIIKAEKEKVKGNPKDAEKEKGKDVKK